ncbi:MAG: GatB/YqeY domain-containing protein [FCB group bacterium]|nr:GatB/YqeY domain-containing protein [FCB group bacterium]
MSLIEKIDKDLIKALKGGDKLAATTLRGLKSDIKYYQIDNILDKLTDEDVLGVLAFAAKKRRDSIEQFKAGGRDDLVDQESRELEIIQQYLPQLMPPTEIEPLVKQAIAETGAESPADIGKIMKVLMPQVKGKADGKVVKEIVIRLLSAK